MTTKSKEWESLVPFHTWCHRTNVTDISIGKFRRHSCRPPVQLFCIFESYKSWPVEAKRKSRLCSRWCSSVQGHKFLSPERLEWVSCVLYLYWTAPVFLAACITR